MILDAIQINLILLSFCMFISCLIMAMTESKLFVGEQRLKVSIEYGIFASAGLIVSVVLGYGYFG
ncbi:MULTISPECIES: hypothetical protein [Pseudoalteromonas]|uniref:Uncharacterized protein n=2 Tax=Pseudoalteromonas TaxID=53246 RepID=V4HDD0_PSEL2|nr:MULTISPECIES: hypothetical protein [Pseudoalteromonas]ESP95446.1 hypothetical protein PL2TA16_02189 [Pseudoalteromonas luteoviolacea 2ta16]KZN31157.1 hypothetical protein N483_04895 [Pseudoalteromonas luteoviolacea NCIMB 1944]MBQ4836274.1 hypothetical protein [Pseudoalteromonas luteoviolacea]MCG7548421.1 hypothetical protein [Pseudoalteromonas sp. Of7M-16]